MESSNSAETGVKMNIVQFFCDPPNFANLDEPIIDFWNK